MVVYGNKSTHQATMDMMLRHTLAVSKAEPNALVIGDMPFGSYQPSIEEAVRNACRFVSEAKAEAVKLEGGIEMVPTVKRIVDCGIPVMGHIGMTPQSIYKFGGAKVQGKREISRNYLIESAQALDDAGVFGIVLELVKKETSEIVTRSIGAPTIGIGAGLKCDGQVLVINDILGLVDDFKPKFVREYASIAGIIEKAAKGYVDDVRAGKYPSDDESF
jgi:3-methyl-2-oxobutanoate hydroxymethyltransferase